MYIVIARIVFTASGFTDVRVARGRGWGAGQGQGVRIQKGDG